MTVFEAILVPLDGSPTALRSLGCAVWLASRLGARLHILNSGAAPRSRRPLEALGVPAQYESLVELHQAAGEPVAEIEAAVARLGIGLVVMTAQGRSGAAGPEGPARVAGHVTQAFIERSAVPVLLLPPSYVESLPWRTVLAPISGEPETDQALALALQLASVLQLQVTVAHVTDGEPRRQSGAGAMHPLDVGHHEYAGFIDELIARACPMCGVAERGRITDVRLLHGGVVDGLQQLLVETHAELMVVGWHGQFLIGHAQVLKTLMKRVRCAVLLVKPARKAPFRLKVGDAFG